MLVYPGLMLVFTVGSSHFPPANPTAMLSYTMKSNRLVFGLIKLTNYLTNYEFELKGNLKEFKNNLELHYFIYVNT